MDVVVKSEVLSTSPTGHSTDEYRRSCEFCRCRKRRCDGGKPSCSTCLRKGLTCVYCLKSPLGRPVKDKSAERQQVVAPQEVVYRRSCEECRRRRIRCNSAKPQCQSCVERGYDCHYAPRKPIQRKRKSSPSNQVTRVVSPRQDTAAYIHCVLPVDEENELLDIFFNKANPERLPQGGKQLLYPTTLTEQLTRLAVIALVARVYRPEKTPEYDERIKEVGGKLFDTFTLDNGFAFFVVAFYYFYRNRRLCYHYGRIALSILDEVKDDCDDLLLTYVMIVYFCSKAVTAMGNHSAGFEKDATKLFANTRTYSLSAPESHIAFHQLVLVMKEKLAAAFEETWAQTGTKNIFDLRLSLDQIQELTALLNVADERFPLLYEEFRTSQKHWIPLALISMRGFVEIASKNLTRAGELALQVLELLGKAEDHLVFRGFPFMVDVLNFIITMFYYHNYVTSLSQALKIRAQIVTLFPEADVDIVNFNDPVLDHQLPVPGVLDDSVVSFFGGSDLSTYLLDPFVQRQDMYPFNPSIPQSN